MASCTHLGGADQDRNAALRSNRQVRLAVSVEITDSYRVRRVDADRKRDGLAKAARDGALPGCTRVRSGVVDGISGCVCFTERVDQGTAAECADQSDAC